MARLDPSVFNLPVEKLKSGWYTDAYFNVAREVLLSKNMTPYVHMQVFQRNNAILCGIDEAVAILKLCSHDWEGLTVKALHDGDSIEPWETVMTIEGDYTSFAHLETAYLGVLARGTLIATNTKRAVSAANGAPVFFFAARHDHYLNQPSDGYAAHIGGALQEVSTDANASLFGAKGMGTIPHALIAAFGGKNQTVEAAKAFNEWALVNAPELKIVILVDFDNYSSKTALAVADALGDRLYGVRLDTSGQLIDEGLWHRSDPSLVGVNEDLVWQVRYDLDDNGYRDVRIIVSGGFTADKIRRFEDEGVPVDAYGVGSSLLRGSNDFTADIVKTNGEFSHKVGRPPRPNKRLELVR